MKTLAAKEKRPASTVRRSHAPVHSPLGAKNRRQQNHIRQILQPKLIIGRPNDKYEREADGVADRVLANQPISEISSIAGAPALPGAQTIQTETTADDYIQEQEIQREPTEEEEEPVQARLIQREPAEEEEEPVQARLIQRQAEEEEEPVQARLIQRQAEEEEEPIQAKLIQRESAEEEEPVQAKLIQRQAEQEEEPVQARLIQRQAEEEEEPVQAKLIQRQAEEEEEPIQAKLIQRQAEQEEEPIQAKLIQRQAEQEEEPIQAKLIQRQAEAEEESVQARLIQRQAEEEEEPVQAKLIQRQAEEEEEPVQAKLIQRQAEQEEEPVQTRLIQRQAEEEEEPVQAKLIQRQAEEEEEPVQAKLIQRQAVEEEEPVQAKLIQRQAEEEEEPVQARLIQRRAEEEEEPVQARLVQRQAEEEEDNVQASGAIPSNQAAARAINNPSSASPMRADVRSILESGMGVDLSDVRVHEDSAAHQAAASINAKAFTHKNDIWLGAAQSQSDLHLMAHETTHVVQQGGGLQPATAGISQAAPRVQRLWNPITAVANVVSDAVEWVGDSIASAVDFIKEKAGEFVSSMPGYSLFTVVIGHDPITGRDVERNGRNFIEAGLDIIPNGSALKQKLEDEGALEEAAVWLDGQIRELDISPTEIGSQLSAFWNSLGIADATRLPSVMDRLLNIVRGPVERIKRFAVNVAEKLLEIVKDYLVSSLINFVKEHTTAYPLLTVILERDPISGEAVERTPIALVRGFMQLSESGAEQLRQMEESGSLQKAADWLDGAVARLNLSWEMIVEGFMSIWNSVGIHSLLDPFGVFRQIYDTFAGPVGRIINFVIEVGTMVLKLIKDALIRRLVEYARTIRGYPLLTVILGRDPFSDEPVERSAENIIHGFMSLMDGGEEQFQEMKQTGAIDRLTTRIENAIATLNFTWEYIKGLFLRAWESFSLQDLAVPFAAFRRLLGIFGEPLGRLISFVGEVIKLVIEVALQLMNFPVALISNIISKAMQAFEDIKRDPIGFLKNLLRAVKTGFVKFFDNIATHLIRGVTGWLFKELEDAGIRPPADLSFQSILGFVLDVLGISVDRIFQKLAAKIGQDKVDRIRGMIDRLTGIWRFVSDVVTRGPVAIWEYIQEQLSNLWNVVLEAVRNWVVTRVVQRVTARLLSMLDPTGIMAVVNGFIAFYNAVQSFIAYLREMLEIVNSFVEGVAEIARGSVESAANFLEGSLGRAVPVAIGFLANQVGLSGLGRRIGEMIERVREMVDRGLDWLIDKAVSAGSALLNMGRSAIGAIRDWWRIRKVFRTGAGESHSVYFKGEGSAARVVVASANEINLGNLLNTKETEIQLLNGPSKAEKVSALSIAKGKHQQIANTQTALSNSNDEAQQSTLKTELNTHFDELAPSLGVIGVGHAEDTELPATDVKFAPMGSKAGKVTADPLSKKEGSISGSRPTADPDGWLSHIMTIPGYSDIYVRLHILSQKLHGPGNDVRNLTPGRKQENTNMEGGAETPAYNITQQNRVLWYESEVTSYRTEAGFTDFANAIRVKYGFMEKDDSNNWQRIGSAEYNRSFPVTKPDAIGTRDIVPSIDTMSQGYWDTLKDVNGFISRESYRNIIRGRGSKTYSSTSEFISSPEVSQVPNAGSWFLRAISESKLRGK